MRSSDEQKSVSNAQRCCCCCNATELPFCCASLDVTYDAPLQPCFYRAQQYKTTTTALRKSNKS
jgi:hypothetical protein